MIIGQGGTTDKAYLPLATREKNPIPNEQRRELSPARLKTIDELWKRERPDAILRSSTAVYNCMGLVFASRRTWVDTSYLEMIFDDDKYTQVEGKDKAKLGDVVVYRSHEDSSVCHIGIVMKIEPSVATASFNITVMSKWGAAGEYIHYIEDVPHLLGRPTELWTDRRVTQ